MTGIDGTRALEIIILETCLSLKCSEKCSKDILSLNVDSALPLSPHVLTTLPQSVASIRGLRVDV
jgi:hypothetical protein